MIKNLKILCLGNEFIKEDSFAKEIGGLLKEKGYDIINIKDSFQLVTYMQSLEEFIILDVVEDLYNVELLDISDLKNTKIISSHDFDASFFMQLLKPKVKIIGIPQRGDVEEIIIEVERLIKNN